MNDKQNPAGPRPDLWLRCHALVEQSPVPTAAVAGPGHVVCYVNPAFCQLLGKYPEDLIGRSFAGLPQVPEAAQLWLDRVTRSGQPESHAEPQTSKPQPHFWAFTLWPVLEAALPEGLMIQVTETTQFWKQTVAMNEALVVGSVRQHELAEAAMAANTRLEEEIAERIKIEAALYEAQERLNDRAGQLEELVAHRTVDLTNTNQQLEALVYSLAHHLRAPLRSMQGFATLLKAEPDVGTELGQHFARRISKSAQFMDDMVAGLLIFSSVAQRRLDLTPINLKTVLESIQSQLRDGIEAKQARVEVVGPWPRVLGHAPTVEWVLMNLLGNALKFVKPDAPPQIRIRTEAHGDLVRVWVEDNGIGLSADHCAQIFKLFGRLHGDQFPGTGVGLATVRHAVQRMGGTVGVETTAGAGCRFWFELRRPLTPAPAKPPADLLPVETTTTA